jgi:hypothetical protein
MAPLARCGARARPHALCRPPQPPRYLPPISGGPTPCSQPVMGRLRPVWAAFSLPGAARCGQGPPQHPRSARHSPDELPWPSHLLERGTRPAIPEVSWSAARRPDDIPGPRICAIWVGELCVLGWGRVVCFLAKSIPFTAAYRMYRACTGSPPR